jgi:hypothetical protein
MAHGDTQTEGSKGNGTTRQVERNELDTQRQPARRGASVPRGSGSIVDASPALSDGLATTPDVDRTRSEVVPTWNGKGPNQYTAEAFTPEVEHVLSRAEEQAFFGTRIDFPQMLTRLERYRDWHGVSTRFQNTAAVAAQIAAPDGAFVEGELSKIMRSWDEFAAARPRDALALQPLREFWDATHPGPTPKNKRKDAAKKAEGVAVDSKSGDASGTVDDGKKV